MSEARDAAAKLTSESQDTAPDSKMGGTKEKPAFYFPTEEACEEYNVRRWMSDYATLDKRSKYNAGGSALNRLKDIAQTATGIETLFDDLSGTRTANRAFLSGPQFQFKPGNIIQDVAAKFTLGLYNGPESAWWVAKTNQGRTKNDLSVDGAIDVGTPSASDIFIKARAVNSIWLEAKNPAPFKVKTVEKEVNGQTVYVSEYDYGNGTSEDDLVKYRMNILPNWTHEDGLEFDHEHTWGKAEDFFTNIMKMATDIGAGALKMAERIKQFNPGDEGPTNNITIVKPDIADTYQSTNRVSFDIPFTLFTRTDFFRDIFGPIMLLNYLSFPKRKDPSKQVQKVLDDLVGGAKEALDKFAGNAKTDADKIQAEEALASVDEVNTSTADSALNFMNSILPGFRIFAADPPAYFNIRHSAGLFFFKNCIVTGFSYKYMGPWVNTTNLLPKSQEGKNRKPSPMPPKNSPSAEKTPFSSIAGAGQDVVGVGQNNFWEFWQTPQSVEDSTWSNAILTYPLTAQCNLKMKVLDPVFAEDWLLQLDNYKKLYAAGSELTPTQDQLRPRGDILSLNGSNPLFG